MRTWHFWSVALPFALGLTAQISVIIHQVSFLRPTLGAAGAAWAVSLTSVCAVLGRLAVGLFVDRVNRRAVIAGNFLLQATSIVLMLSGPRPALLYVACAMFGLGVGNTTSLPSVIVQAEFPRAAFGQVVSTIIAINQFTYSFGPGLLGWLRDGFGSYDAAFAGLSPAPAGGRHHSALRRIEIAAGGACRVGGVACTLRVSGSAGAPPAQRPE